LRLEILIILGWLLATLLILDTGCISCTSSTAANLTDFVLFMLPSSCEGSRVEEVLLHIFAQLLRSCKKELSVVDLPAMNQESDLHNFIFCDVFSLNSNVRKVFLTVQFVEA
jgi:hypothetical protein